MDSKALIPVNRRIAFSYCSGGVSSTTLEKCAIPFDEFSAAFKVPEIGEKDGSYFVRGSAEKRSDKYLKSADLVILDGDSTIDISTGEITEGAPPAENVHKILKAHDIQHLIYTSYSHMVKGHRYRVVIPAKIESKNQLVAVVDYIIQLLHSRDVFLNNVSENSCWSQAWYLPRVPKEHVDAFKFFTFDTSTVLDVESICLEAKGNQLTAAAKTKSSQQLLLSAPSEMANIAVLKSVIKKIDASAYNDWIKVGFAIHYETGGSQAGLDLWDEWSQAADNYKDADECEYKWSTFDTNSSGRTATIKSLQRMAGITTSTQLTVSNIHPVIEDMNKRYALVSVGSKTKILKEPPSDRSDDGISLLSEHDFSLLERNKLRVQVGDTLVCRSKFWMSHPNRREYEGLMFHPKITHPGFYNMYKGFGVEAIQGDPSLFLSFIETVICKNDQGNFQCMDG